MSIDMTNNNNTNSKCPKCSSTMVQHPSLLSMPLTSSSSSSSSAQQHSEEHMKKMNIEDQDANFIFKFISCEKCGYSEFFLNDRGRRI